MVKDLWKNRVISFRKGDIIAAMLKAIRPFNASRRIVNVKGSTNPMLKAISDTTKPSRIQTAKNSNKRLKNIKIKKPLPK